MSDNDNSNKNSNDNDNGENKDVLMIIKKLSNVVMIMIMVW